MERILDRLWCGSLADAAVLAPGGPIRRIVHLALQDPPVADVIHTVEMPILDEVFLGDGVWETLTWTIQECLSARGEVLVHCRLGKSRAPSACAAYLIRAGYRPDKALALVRRARPQADPHPETWRSVLAWARQNGYS